jgi:hypothetical protein
MSGVRSALFRAIFLVGGVASVAIPYAVCAEELFTVAPIVESLEAKPRDILKKELRLLNPTSRKLNIYAQVVPVDSQVGDEAFVTPTEADQSTSLANWIEITRGVIELSAGEEKTIPYLINTNMRAQPGVYHARIVFASGTTRAEAEQFAEIGPSLLISLTVKDDGIEKLELDTFSSAESIFTGGSAQFTYALENIGNRSVTPRGEIRIFNRKGEEVGVVPVNADGGEITPEKVQTLAAAWDANGRFGKYKAYLDIEYGDRQVAAVNDTVYFWVLPWKQSLLSLISIVALAVVGTYIVHLRSLSSARPQFALVADPVPQRQGRERSSGRLAPAQVTLSARDTAPIVHRPPSHQSAHGHVVTLQKR